MESEYSHLENLVQDVSNIDTARMTLRWALERLNILERSNRELDEKFRNAVQSQQAAERRMAEVEAQVASRMRHLSDQEAFYKKLEQTVAVLSEGKVDLAQIARKEVDLEAARHEVAAQYREKFEALEREHREMVAHWTERLMQAQSYNPEQVSETLRQYDEYRRNLDHAYQERLVQLEQGFHQKEEEFLKRERELEAGCQARLKEVELLRVQLESKLGERIRELEASQQSLKDSLLQEMENRRARLEAEHQSRKESLLAETERLKEELRHDFHARTESWNKEQQGRLLDLSQAWEWERQRFVSEQKMVQERLRAALSRVGELEELLAASDKRGRDEIVTWLADAERSFQLKTQDFERLQAEARAALEDRGRELEESVHRRRQDLDHDYQAKLSAYEQEMEHKELVLQEGLRAERARMAEQVGERDALIRQLQDKLKAVENRLVVAESTEQAHALDVLRAQMNNEFQKTLDAREKALIADFHTKEEKWEEEILRIKGVVEERDQMLVHLRHQLQETQEQLIRSESTDQAAALEAQRSKMAAEFQQIFAARNAELAAELKAKEEDWEKKHYALRLDVKDRDDMLLKLRGQLQETLERLIKAESTDQAEAMGALRATLTREFQEASKAREAEIAADNDMLHRQLMERDAMLMQLRQELLTAQDSLIRAQSTEQAAALESLRATLTREFQETSKAREAEIAADNDMLHRQLEERDAILIQLRQDLLQTQDRLIRAESTDQAAALEALRVKMTQESQSLLKAQEVKLRAECDVLQSQLAEREASIMQLRQEMLETQDRLIRAKSTDQVVALEAEHEKMSQELQKALAVHDAAADSAMKVQLEEWAKAREALQSQIAERDGLLIQLRQELQEAQNRWIRSESTRQSVNVHEELAKLCAEKEELVAQQHKLQADTRTALEERMRLLENEFIQRREALERQYRERMAAMDQERDAERQKAREHQVAERDQTERLLQTREIAIQELRNQAKAREDAWKKEKADLISRFESEYQAKKQELVLAFEEYRNELDKREAAVRALENKS